MGTGPNRTQCRESHPGLDRASLGTGPSQYDDAAYSESSHLIVCRRGPEENPGEVTMSSGRDRCIARAGRFSPAPRPKSSKMTVDSKAHGLLFGVALYTSP